MKVKGFLASCLDGAGGAVVKKSHRLGRTEGLPGQGFRLFDRSPGQAVHVQCPTRQRPLRGPRPVPRPEIPQGSPAVRSGRHPGPCAPHDPQDRSHLRHPHPHGSLHRLRSPAARLPRAGETPCPIRPAGIHRQCAGEACGLYLEPGGELLERLQADRDGDSPRQDGNVGLSLPAGLPAGEGTAGGSLRRDDPGEGVLPGERHLPGSQGALPGLLPRGEAPGQRQEECPCGDGAARRRMDQLAQGQHPPERSR